MALSDQLMGGAGSFGVTGVTTRNVTDVTKPVTRNGKVTEAVTGVVTGLDWVAKPFADVLERRFAALEEKVAALAVGYEALMRPIDVPAITSKVMEAVGGRVEGPRPAGKSNADRQREYRRRKREGG